MSSPDVPKPMAYVGNPLDRTGNWRRDEALVAAKLADPATRFLPVWHLQTLVRGEQIKHPAWVRRQDLGPPGAEAAAVSLGLDGETAHFAIDVSNLDEREARERFAPFGTFAELRSVHAEVPAGETAILATARALTDWHRRHGFCAACGHPSVSRQAGYVRLCTHEACGRHHFPRTDPVVIMLIAHGDRCLLGRQDRFPADWYSTLAGFVEPGETVEEAVRREVKEETAIDVGAVRYAFSQPWPYPSSLMIGCFGEALGHEIAVDGHELAEARWFERAAVRAALRGEPEAGFRVPPALAVAHHLIAHWAER